MNIWLIGEGVLLLALVIALWRRNDLAGYFHVMVMVVCGLLLAITLTHSVVDAPGPLTLGLGALAMIFFGIEIVRQMRTARGRDG